MDHHLRLSEKQYRMLTENIPIGIYHTTPEPEGRFLMVNPALLELLGFESERELSHIRAADLYYDQRMYTEFLAQLIAQGRVKGIELQLQRKDGIPIWGSVTARVIYDDSGEIAWFDCTVWDITERKLLQDLLRESEEKFRYIAEFSPLPLAILDKKGVFEYFNPMFTDVFGYTIADIPTRTKWRELAYPDPLYRQQVSDAWKKDIIDIGKDELKTITVSVTCKNGLKKEVFLKAVFMESGKFLFTYEVINDK